MKNALTNAEIDEAIIAVVLPRWRKVAMVVSNASQRLGIDEEEGYDRVAMRVSVLVRKGRLESQGNVKRWRFSEVRLPGFDSE